MQSAIMYNPEEQDNFYYIIAQAGEMKADLTDFTEIRRLMEKATFSFYIVAIKDEETGITSLTPWYMDTFRRTWKFTTEQEHLRFKEIERV